MDHRISLVEQWDIKPGSRVLEVGCGQGDCTVILAAAVGENGHVVAVDPGALDYGSPETLGQAQGNISKGPMGSRITFIQATPIEHLQSLQSEKKADSNAFEYDYAVLAHSLWYFSSPTEISQTLSIISKHAKQICIAEWSLSPSKTHPAESYPHVLAAVTMATLSNHLPLGSSMSNIRTMVSPEGIKGLADGLVVEKEGWVTPDESILDGKWEVEWVLSKRWEEKLFEKLAGEEHERTRGLILAMRDSVRSALPQAPSMRGIRSMDVWCATFRHTE